MATVYNSASEATKSINGTVYKPTKPMSTLGQFCRTHPESMTNYELEVTWTCAHTHSKIDHFELDIEFYSTKRKSWLQYNNGTVSVPTSSLGKVWSATKKKWLKRYTYVFTPTFDVSVSKFRARVRAISKTHSVTAYYNKVSTDSKGKKKYTKTKVTKQVKYFATSDYSNFKSVEPWGDIREIRPERPGIPSAELMVNGYIKVSFDPIDPDKVDTCRFIYREKNGSVKVLPKAAGINGGDHRMFDNATFAVDTKVTPGNSYRYYARAHNKYGSDNDVRGWDAEPSLPAELSDPVNTPPVEVTGLEAVGYGDNGALVSFTYPGYYPALLDDLGGGGVRVYYSKDRGVLATNKSECDSVSIAKEAVGRNMQVIIQGLESGTYWFGVGLSTGPMDIQTLFCKDFASCSIASVPEPPTMLSVPMAVCIGDTLRVGWVHNCEDGSAQTAAQMRLTATKPDGTAYTKTYSATSSEFADVSFDAGVFPDETRVSFQARTKGAARYKTDSSGARVEAWSEWSDTVETTVYAKPVAQLSLGGTASASEEFEGYDLPSLPLVAEMGVIASAGNLTQDVVQWTLSLVSEESFTYLDALGNDAVMAAGEMVCEVVSNSIDGDFAQPEMELAIPASQAVFYNGQAYRLTLSALMDSGLEAEAASCAFRCAFDADGLPSPDAEIETTGDWGARIYPSVVEERPVPDGAGYIVDSGILRLAPLDGSEPDDGQLASPLGSFEVRVSYVLDGEPSEFTAQWDGTPDDIDMSDVEWDSVESVSYREAGSGTWTELAGEAHRGPYQDESVLLSVYRVDRDGGMVEVVRDIPNAPGCFAYDRHPSFGQMTYRIVANDPATDEVSSADAVESNDWHGYLIQWDEDSGSYESNYDDEDDSGMNFNFSWVHLPLDNEMSHSNAKDCAMQGFSGRSHPRSVYGTQVGDSGSWSCNIVKDHQDWELSQLRKLGVYMGDVWVRDSSGLNYPACVNVSESRSSKTAAINVSLEVKRVDDDRLA